MTAEETTGPGLSRAVPAEGVLTGLPRRTHDPVPGTTAHEAAVPDDLVTPLRRLAAELRIPLSTVLLTAHAKVLAALSGEREVATGYVAARGGTPLPCPLSTASATWRSLLLDTRRAEAGLLAQQESPAAVPEHGPGSADSLPESVFDPTGDEGSMTPGTVLRVAVLGEGGGPVLQLRYRSGFLDTDGAARIAGYHLAALDLMAADPDAAHQRQSLLSAGELRFQLEGLTGPHRELPSKRFHELFEEQVRAHPHAVAAVHADRQLTYQELNIRANRLAHALLAEGTPRQSVVAVVAERNLDWMAAVLAIFKARCVYLPIEPHFPADRIATMLCRASCTTVLTEPAGTTGLDQALESLPAVRKFSLRTASEAGGRNTDPGLGVAPDDLAYIYFTSGSTGEPKGAMCEHQGMLNHLYAKIDDLGIGGGMTVAQTAPQCFDISLWQLLSALLVGGRTLLVGQEAVLDVRRFLDTIVAGRACVLQVVPSYLDAVLSFLEQHPRELPDLRCVSVTGEAVKKELVRRWFATEPGIRLVNAYGLTETSDDTNHEVMDRVPDTDRIPLGRPVSNVRVYVVDEHLAPVPLGAPGEIVFSGVCVGRGYVNDPERTRAAFLDDPHHPGARLYRSGDRGRWRSDRKLEFLGRRDNQVKISGFRIEIGEIENTLLHVPQVRDGAVVATGKAGRGQRLVAFYTSGEPLPEGDVRDRLRTSLPAYMVPSAFHWRTKLPLTANGKTDRKALVALAGTAGAAEHDRPAPGTPTEQRIAAAWASALTLPPDRISRQDNFFDCGGSSLSAVRVAICLDRVVSLKDLTRHPVLADLAALVDARSLRHTTGTPDPSEP